MPVVPTTRLKKRHDFVKISQQGRRFFATAFVLQVLDRGENDPLGPVARVGFTTSRKVGSAVQRNRARRRLRELARLTLPAIAQPGYDYVFVGTKAAIDYPFAQMQQELAKLLSS
ncbi:MAG: ribonuclease P protein component [Alphaproteobacteria bacterium]|nr:ribonuclease P protein component [Alphaproteobacteria bacterium]